MPQSEDLPHPDLAADREALSLAWPEIVKRLTEIIGKKLAAHIAGVKDVRALDRWINGTEPYGDVEERLRFAYQVVRALSQHDSPRIVQAWLTGVNPELGDRVPLRVLRDGDLSTGAPEILGAARAFIAEARFARQNWAEVQSLSTSQHHYLLASRAIGEQGIAAFLLGDIATAKKDVLKAWMIAMVADPAAHIRYASMYGTGLAELHKYKEAMGHSTRQSRLQTRRVGSRTQQSPSRRRSRHSAALEKTGKPWHWQQRRCGGFQATTRLTVIQCDQTTVWVIPKIVCREEVGRSLQGPVCFVLRERLQHGNNLDCSTGAFSARRRGLGIFALAALTRLLNKCVRVFFDPICGFLEKDRLRLNPERPVP
jgi:hypothetical protein